MCYLPGLLNHNRRFMLALSNLHRFTSSLPYPPTSHVKAAVPVALPVQDSKQVRWMIPAVQSAERKLDSWSCPRSRFQHMFKAILYLSA